MGDEPVCCATRDSDTPGGCVRNTDRSGSRKRDRKQKKVTGLWRAGCVAVSLVTYVSVLKSSQVSVKVFRTPVLDDD